MLRYFENWLGKSRMIGGALAVLLTLLCSINVAHAQDNRGFLCISNGPPTATNPQPTLPKGFTEEVLFVGCLTNPTAISFNASMTKAFVAEKAGMVWRCDVSATDHSTANACTLVADLSSEVCPIEDRGLLGLAVDPLDEGNVYVLYTTPHQCTGSPNVTGSPALTGGQLSLLRFPAGASSPPLATETKILPAAGATTSPWCFAYTSHSIGSLVFGVDNKTLYVSAGEGASFDFVDLGTKDDLCGDNSTNPPHPPQGAYRSQGPGGAITTNYTEGAILQIANPGTPNPSFVVVAFGLRNPFRFARLPGGTDELYVGNVGWDLWESIDHVVPERNPKPNFGWPCYEGWDPNNNFGPAPQPRYQSMTEGQSLCPGIVMPPPSTAVTGPFFAYAHNSFVTRADRTGKNTCGPRPSGGGPDQNGSVISAIGFTDGTSATYPPPFNQALYFGDLLRKCIWTMQPSSQPSGQPADNAPQTFAKGLQGGPVDLKVGPAGDLYYVDLFIGTVRRFIHR